MKKYIAGRAWESLKKIKPGSLDEIEATNLLQYLDASKRKAFMAACYRALKKDGKVFVITPHWSAQRYYNDLEVAWPPVSDGWFQCLHADLRKANGIKGYACDFDVVLGYGMHPMIASRNQDYQQHAIQFWKEAAQDVHVTLIKR